MVQCYDTYRDGSRPLAKLLGAGLDEFHKRRGRTPNAIAVNPKALTETQEALKALELKVPVQVQAIGGCLVGEVWLGYEET